MATLFFVYVGDLDIDIYVSRLSQLSNPKIAAAFPTREQAVDYALGIVDKTERVEIIKSDKVSAVVVERELSLRSGDENNLISECQWNTSLPPATIPELKGDLSITGKMMIEETLTAEKNNLTDGGIIKYQWLRSNDGENFGTIPLATNETYTLTEEDVGKYIGIEITRENTNGSLGFYTDVKVEYKLIQGKVEIGGIEIEGETLYAVITENTTNIGLHYKWRRAESENGLFAVILGAVEREYVLTADDVGKFLEVNITQDHFSGMLVSPLTGEIAEGA